MQLPHLFTSLLVRPKPLEVEDQWQFWLRLADENGLLKPQWLLAPGARWATGRARVCSECLRATKACWHRDWDEPEGYWCVRHLVWLVDVCRGCHRPLLWYRVRLRECACGHDLRALETAAVDGRILAHVEAGTISLSALRVLGAFALFGSSAKPGKKASRMGLEDVRTQLEAGADLVEQWPTTFIEALDRHREPAASAGSAQLLAEAFPRIRQLCVLIHDEVWRERIEEAIRDYCAGSLAGAAPVFGRSAVLRTGPMTLKQIATRLGTRVETVACAIDAHGEGFRGKRVTAQGRRRRIVGDSDLPGLEDLLREPITVTGAARLLALPVSRLRAIVRAGLLAQVNGRLGRGQVMAFADPVLHGVQITAGASTPQVPVSGDMKN